MRFDLGFAAFAVAAAVAAVLALRAGNGFGVALYGGGAVLFALGARRAPDAEPESVARGAPDSDPESTGRVPVWFFAVLFVVAAARDLARDVRLGREFDIPRALLGAVVGLVVVAVFYRSWRRR